MNSPTPLRINTCAARIGSFETHSTIQRYVDNTHCFTALSLAKGDFSVRYMKVRVAFTSQLHGSLLARWFCIQCQIIKTRSIQLPSPRAWRHIVWYSA